MCDALACDVKGLPRDPNCYRYVILDQQSHHYQLPQDMMIDGMKENPESSLVMTLLVSQGVGIGSVSGSPVSWGKHCRHWATSIGWM